MLAASAMRTLLLHTLLFQHMFTEGASNTGIAATYPYKWLILKDLISTNDNSTDA